MTIAQAAATIVIAAIRLSPLNKLSKSNLVALKTLSMIASTISM